MPPLQALAALHGFWLLLFVPGILWAGVLLTANTLRWLGLGLLLLGGAGLALVVIHTLFIWLPQTPGGQAYLLQRILFVVATFADAPLLPLTIAGGLCLLLTRSPQAPGV